MFAIGYGCLLFFGSLYSYVSGPRILWPRLLFILGGGVMLSGQCFMSGPQ